MRVVVLAPLVLAGCYSPELRDCAVMCSDATECAHDQVCGADGFCAAPDVAGTCAAPDDPKVSLHAMVMGPGSLEVAGVGTCAMDCRWDVSEGATVQIRAVAGTKEFERWTSPNCEQQGTTCTLQLTAPTTVSAKFH